jgi:ornithine cyclodeaminase/alanine dehydrogenase-like protein (mu-crystallin family)
MELVDAAELRRRVPMSAAIDALERSFREQDPSDAPLRTRVATPEGELLLMPAAGAAGVGVKLVTLTPANPGRGLPLVNAAYVLFEARTQEPAAVIDGAALTALRTAAVSGLATRYLARADAHRLVVFGAGVQANAHLDAMLAERPVDRVAIVSRGPGPAEELRTRAESLGLSAVLADAGAVGEADLVCTCTTSSAPVFDGSALAAGAHVNAVGAYRPDARELDTEVVRRARLVVETRQAAFEEAGDLLIPIGEGAIDRGHVVADLAELVRGEAARTSAGDVTVFKSVGIAFEDLVVARAAMEAS